MAGWAFPTTAWNNRALTSAEYEALMFPAMPDGVFGHPEDPPVVYADGTPLTLKVRAKRVLYIRGLRYETGDTEQTVALAANNSSGTSRRDLVVARMTRNPWNVTIEKVSGTPAVNPITPSPNYGTALNSGVWELPLAVATVNYNSTAVTVSPLHWYVGSSGQIRCTSSTRPPHEAGRVIWEDPPGRWSVSTGGRWVTAWEDSGTTRITLASGWTANKNYLYRRSGWVFAALSPQRTGSAIAENATVTLGTVPNGFRPPFDFETVGFSVSSAAQVVILIRANGQVTATAFVAGIAQQRFINVAALAWPAA